MSKHSVVIKWSDCDDGYIATVPELEGLSAFGNTPEEAARELSIAKDLYLEVMKEDGHEIPDPEILKPYSGQIRLRMPKRLHETLSETAKAEGVSLNMLIVSLLSERNAHKQFKREIEKLRNEIELIGAELPSMTRRGIALVANKEIADMWSQSTEETDLKVYPIINLAKIN